MTDLNEGVIGNFVEMDMGGYVIEAWVEVVVDDSGFFNLSDIVTFDMEGAEISLIHKISDPIFRVELREAYKDATGETIFISQF